MHNSALTIQLPLPMFQQCSDRMKPVEREKYGVRPTKGCDLLVCCPDLPDYAEIQIQAGGYDFEIASQVTQIPKLPQVICAIEGDQGHRPYMAAINDKYWAVKYQSAIAGDLSDNERIVKWRIHQGIPPDKRLIFHQESNDKELDRFFDKEHDPSFFAMLKSMPDSIFISPGYSVYTDDNMCRHHQLLNMKLSLDYFVRASSHGLRCIPCLGWDLHEDIVRLAAWIKAQPGLRYIAINCQTLRKRQYTDLRKDMELIEFLSKRQLHWVVFGGMEAIRQLHTKNFWKRIHLITASPVERARSGRTIFSQLKMHNKVDAFKLSRAGVQSMLELA